MFFYQLFFGKIIIKQHDYGFIINVMYCNRRISGVGLRIFEEPARKHRRRGEAVSKLDKMWPTEISALPKEPVDNWNYLHVRSAQLNLFSHSSSFVV